MKKLLFLAAMAPLFSFAQPLNTMNNPNLPGYEIPSQQRMQVQMQTQQMQQKGMLNQQLQTQNRVQQQHLDTQINNDTRRVLQSQPGGSRPERAASAAKYLRGHVKPERQRAGTYAAAEDQRQYAKTLKTA